MITSNVIQRTIHIGFEGQIATGFFIDIDQRQYLVTAKHVVTNIKMDDVISIFHNNQWCETSVKLVGHAPGEADISLLALTYRIAGEDLTLTADASGLIVGQDVFFLGFPFGLFGEMGALNNASSNSKCNRRLIGMVGKMQ